MGIKKNLVKALVVLPSIYLDHFASNRRSQIFQIRIQEELVSTKPILFYVHHSKMDRVSALEISTLQELQDLGFAIYLIMNSDNPKTLDISPILENFKSDPISIIIRKNTGRDLGAYRDAYILLEKANFLLNKKIFFMNNSVIWFPKMISDYFERLLASSADIIAGSISFQHQVHIQTFLFGVNTDMGRIGLEDWLLKIKNWHLKRSIVTFGELRTNLLFGSNLNVESIPSLESSVSLGLRKIHESENTPKRKGPSITRLINNRNLHFAGISLNPSHNYWLELFELGLPGIKQDLIMKNPSMVPDYERIVEQLLDIGIEFDDLAKMLLANKPKSLIVRIRSLLKI